MKEGILLKRISLYTLILFVIFIGPTHAQNKYIALTIDDLPFVGEEKNYHLNRIIHALKTNHVPATGFIIAGTIRPENWEVLYKFKNAGLSLGNHSLSHKNLNQVQTDIYLRELEKAESILSPLLTDPKFFRYPYMAEGTGEKKERVARYLSEKHYHVAPITIDSKDFIFNQLLLSIPESKRRSFLHVLKPTYLNYIWEQTLKSEENHYSGHPSVHGQILLVHANLLNAYVLPDIIAMYRSKGYRFIRLEEALAADKTLDDNQNADFDDNLEAYWDWD